MKRIPLKQFFGDQSGSILLLVGISFIVLVTAAGAGYDLAKYTLVKQKIQQASDAAALAGASLPVGASIAQRTTEANMYFSLNYPATYLGVPRPTPTITVNGDVKVTASATMNTNFVANVGVNTTTSSGLSQVQIAATASSDYDVVMVVDESGSENASLFPCAAAPYPCTREGAQQDALRTMANTVVPVSGTNPNVRMGIIGFSGQITNKWGLSNKNADAINAISKLRPVYQNYDHVALLAAQKMLLGGQGAPNAKIGAGLGDGTVALNITQPNPRTARTNTSDANGISPTKYVVFLSDGGIMLEPSDSMVYGPLYYDLSGYVHAACPGRTAAGPACHAAFLNACTVLRNTGGTDNVHLFFINLKATISPAQQATLTACASPSVAGAPIYPPSEKPDPTKDFFFANTTAELQSILTNITSTIQKQRIVQ